MFLTGSKVGLGTPWRRIRDLFGPPLGLESCWGFAVSHASSTPWALKFKPTEAEAAIHLPSTARLTFSSSGFRGSGASVSPRFEGRVRHTLVFRRFGSAAEGAVRVSV